MYSSLDRVDILLAPDADGHPRYVQTDHRTAEEVEEEPALSILFAVVRLLNPRRMVLTVNPLGKAIKRFANGDGDSLVTLANLLLSQPWLGQ